MAIVEYIDVELDVIIVDDEITHVFYSCPMDTEADIKQILENLGADMEELKQLALDKMKEDADDIAFQATRDER